MARELVVERFARQFQPLHRPCRIAFREAHGFANETVFVFGDEVRQAAAQGDGAAQATVDAYEQALSSMVDFGKGLAQRYSRESAVLEFERGLSVFFSHGAKKRYIGQVVWPTHEMLVRGYETLARNELECRAILHTILREARIHSRG